MFSKNNAKAQLHGSKKHPLLGKGGWKSTGLCCHRNSFWSTSRTNKQRSTRGVNGRKCETPSVSNLWLGQNTKYSEDSFPIAMKIFSPQSMIFSFAGKYTRTFVEYVFSDKLLTFLVPDSWRDACIWSNLNGINDVHLRADTLKKRLSDKRGLKLKAWVVHHLHAVTFSSILASCLLLPKSFLQLSFEQLRYFFWSTPKTSTCTHEWVPGNHRSSLRRNPFSQRTNLFNKPDKRGIFHVGASV